MDPLAVIEPFVPPALGPLPSGPVPPVSRTAAAAVASSAFVVPLALSWSSSPSPLHPQVWAWYQSLRMPAYKPPDLAIPLAWNAIETALAVAAYRLLRAPPTAARRQALLFWGWNVFMIGAWSRLFFGRQELGISTLAAASMIGTAALYVKKADRVDRKAAVAGVPLLAWVAFATVLTAGIWRRNRG